MHWQFFRGRVSKLPSSFCILHSIVNLREWLGEMTLSKPPQVYEIELRERMNPVEEELKNQRDLMEKMLHQMDKRFEQVDKRFEDMLLKMFSLHSCIAQYHVLPRITTVRRFNNYQIVVIIIIIDNVYTCTIHG